MIEPRSRHLQRRLAPDPQLLLGVEHFPGVDHRFVVAPLERHRPAVDAAQQQAFLQLR